MSERDQWLQILQRIIAKMLGGIPLDPDEAEWLSR